MGEDEQIPSAFESITSDGNAGNVTSGENAATTGGTATGGIIIPFAADHHRSGIKSSFDSAVKRDVPIPIPGSLRSLRVASIGISGRPRRVLRDPTDDSIGSDESLEDRRRRSGDSGGVSSESDDRKLDDRKKTASAELPKNTETVTEAQSERKVVSEGSVHVSQSQNDSGDKSQDWRISSKWKPMNGLEELREELQALQMLNKKHQQDKLCDLARTVSDTVREEVRPEEPMAKALVVDPIEKRVAGCEEAMEIRQPSLENRQAGLERQPSVENRQASLERQASVENRQAGLERQANVENRQASLERQASDENRRASFERQASCENRQANFENRPAGLETKEEIPEMRQEAMEKRDSIPETRQAVPETRPIGHEQPKLRSLDKQDVAPVNEDPQKCDKYEEPCQQRHEEPEKKRITYEEPVQNYGATVQERQSKDAAVAARPREATTSRRSSREFITVNSKRYQSLFRIGSGGSSDVFKVINGDCTIYALKRISLRGRDHETAYSFYQEIEYLERLRGKQHIIQLIDYEITDKHIFQRTKGLRGNIQSDVYILMVLEYGEVDLARMLERKKRETDEDGSCLDENWLRLYWEHILKAVNTIHEQRIVHADLKPANFILVEGVLKLIDFGIAKAIQNDTTHIERESQMGTVNYMSPEALMYSKGENGTLRCGRASDIWSLGCILYQMVYGKTPFAHLNFYQKITMITDPEHVIKFPASCSNPLILDVIKSCLRWDKSQRPRIPELLQHPFLRPRIVSADQFFLKETILQSCKTYALLRGTPSLREVLRILLRDGEYPREQHEQHQQQQLDEALLQLCRLYMQKFGKTALHDLLMVLL